MELPKPGLKQKLILLFILTATVPLTVNNLILLNVQDISWTFALILTLFFLVAEALLSLFFAHKVTKPVEELETGSGYINGGNLNYRIRIQSGDEFEHLGETFNVLAQKLQESTQKSALDRDIILTEKNKSAVTLSSIADAVIAVDLSRNVTVFNKAAQQLTGFTAQEAIGKPIGSLIKIFENTDELSSLLYCPIKTDTFEGIVFNKQDLKLVSLKKQPQHLQPNHKEAFINLVVSHITEGTISNVGCVMTLHDITKEKQLEAMKLDFVTMAAHELRTPLTSIKGYLSVFLQESSKNLSEEQMMFLNRIDISTQQLGGLVDNLLSVSRIEKGMLSVATQPIDWTPLVKDVVNSFSNSAKEKKIQLTFIEPTQPVPKVSVDRLRITEVLFNLLSNAITYTHPGGIVKVWIETAPTEIITHIGDTGEGIPKEALPHLFTKFFRVAGNLEQGSKGTGLGLYISKAIIQVHKGKIWVSSELGKGSVFSFSLPL
ncbi:PAS domain S-box protein [Candidatus Daviesbacteria bacterium]|nr:PAS domain S-box protein [Candidatus Daviesbacteria bacterium]